MPPQVLNMKRFKKRSWYKREGAESVIFVPCTANEELKKKYEQKTVAEKMYTKE